MIALALVVALAAPAVQMPAVAHAQHGYVVQFCSHTDPTRTARELQRLQAAGLKDMRTVSAPISGKRHVYRVVSRRFATYAEAKLALAEAGRILKKDRIPFGGIVLDAAVAGAPLIR